MEKDLKKILAELYQLDPQLKKHEAKLMAVLEKLLAARPDIQLDQAFVKRLRAELLGQGSQAKTNSFNFNFMQKFGYLLGGAVIASLLIVPTMLTNFAGPASLDLADFSGEQKITLVGEQAFGLGQLNAPGSPAAMGMEASFDSAKISARPQSGGGGGFAGTSLIYPGPDAFTQFKYVYTGEPLDLGSDKLEVLRRSKATLPNTGSLAGALSLGLIDKNKLSAMKFENMVMGEGGNGVRVVTDFINGEVFINQDSAYGVMEGEYRPIQPNEVPSDNELISIANNFVKQYGIKLDNYGQPEVMASNRIAVDLFSTRPDMYIPDVFTVVYPLSVRELPVYDQGGNANGIMVSISLRTKKVVSVSGIATHNYEASLYEVVSDINTLLDQYQNRYAYYPEGMTVNTVEIKLGTPKLVFTTIYTYANNESQRLLVPAYSFPIIDRPAEYDWYSSSVVVPLVPGLDGSGPVQIMPAGEPLMIKGSTGATEPAVTVTDPAVAQ